MDSAQTDPRESREPLGEERALTLPRDDRLKLPLAAMAEALRANAEALKRLDASQRDIADRIERGDKSANVIASTKALNETFRGLSDIQRGLLDAVVTGRGKGGGGGTLFLAIVVAGLAGLCGFLLLNASQSKDQVTRSVYEDARGEIASLRKKESALQATAAGLQRSLETERTARKDAATSLKEAQASDRELRSTLADLQQKISQNKQTLQNYVQVKAQADLAGTLQVQNLGLKGQIQDLRDRLDRAEQERKRLTGLLAQQKLDSQEGDPQKILDAARRKGLIPKEKPSAPSGDVALDGAGQRFFLRRLNRLLRSARKGDQVEVLETSAIADGNRLLNVCVGRYDGPRLLNSIQAKEMEVFVDAKADTVELRLKDGFLANAVNPDQKVPFADGTQSLFLRGAGIADWLSEYRRFVEVGPKGLVSFRAVPEPPS